MTNFYQKNIEHLCSTKNFKKVDLGHFLSLSTGQLENPDLMSLIRISRFFNVDIERMIYVDLSYAPQKGQIKMLVLDVDGVMTDGGMYFTENGDQIKKYNTKDGMAIMKLRKEKFPVAFLSSGFTNHMVQDRASLLNLEHVYVGREPKIGILKNWCNELNIQLNEVAYVGDDINDIEIMESCGLSACPKDAVSSVKNKAHIVLESEGGRACVREFIDLYLSDQIIK